MQLANHYKIIVVISSVVGLVIVIGIGLLISVCFQVCVCLSYCILTMCWKCFWCHALTVIFGNVLVYKNDSDIIPKNTSVTITRVPVAKVFKG